MLRALPAKVNAAGAGLQPPEARRLAFCHIKHPRCKRGMQGSGCKAREQRCGVAPRIRERTVGGGVGGMYKYVHLLTGG